jgi:hypothetical protein
MNWLFGRIFVDLPLPSGVDQKAMMIDSQSARLLKLVANAALMVANR